MADLKLLALDPEDLAVVSAHLQDAVLKVGDMAYLPRQRRFAMVLNRFDWMTAQPGRRKRPAAVRHRSAFRLERVLAAQVSGIDLKAKSRVLSLLAVHYEPAEAPQGTVVLLFSGGAAIRLEVDCIEAELRDLGASWGARGTPDHHRDGEGAGVAPGPETPAGSGRHRKVSK